VQEGAFILSGALSAALIVASGAVYAYLFGLGKLRRSAPLLGASFAAYIVLALSTFVLARVLELEGYWLIVVVTMLLGYLFAPLAIWHLCVATHRRVPPPASSAELEGR
jgi:hypothetical protein